MTAGRSVFGVALVAMLALVGCSAGPILANPPLVLTVPPTAAPATAPPADPVAISLPRDDGPHDRLTEWWYYTGHLETADGRHFGFEAVIFRAERGDVPVTWASHLALTDESGGHFRYAQRSEIGPAADHSPRDSAGAPTGFDLGIVGFDPSDPTAPPPSPWRLSGSGGTDRIDAALSPNEAGAAGGSFGLDLSLQSTKPPALHDGIGWVPFGPAGGSYYYSRTRMSIGGTLSLDGARLVVTGSGWFDHQWGDFIAVGGGGWDWYAVNLVDGTDLTISVVRGADGSPVIVYGTLVDPSGSATHLDASAFTIASTGSWSSPATGAVYPAGWRIEIPSQRLAISLMPTIADQELDTRPTTGVVYWEGSQQVAATLAGRPLGGAAYVELTGYAPAASTQPATP